MLPPPARLYAGQFVLGTALSRVPEGWAEYAVGRWTLATDLPVCSVLDPDGRTVGALIGFAVTPDGAVRDTPLTLPEPPRPDTATAVEDAVYAHGGRFACVVAADGFERLYLDPGGTLAAVYGWGGAASTGTLLAWAHERTFRAPSPPLPRDGFFYAGRTSDPEVQRLVINHYADLAAGGAVRHHWNEAPVCAPDSETPALVREIADGIRRTIRAAASRGPVHMGITAGRDSRMLLACAREVRDALHLYTFAHPSSGADVAVGRAISRKMGLPHTVIPIETPSEATQEEYLVRTGYAGHWGKAMDFYVGVGEHLAPGRPLLSGFGGEIARGNRMQYVLTPDTPITPEMMLDRYEDAALPERVEALQRWFDGVTWTDTFAFLAQAYWENRFGCWAGPHLYGTAQGATPLVPFIDRRVVDAMARLPAAYRLESRIADDLIGAGWPELEQFPYQRRPGLPGFAVRVYDAVRRRTVGRFMR
ncbi:hypothetical protein [Rubrivirga litoralis]|uniref:Asparagine synthase n=1 Tax=Rubrivirga litoralis TaxID=3075598 RepID=A0ABU3BSE4_9BACT|nr:hypothetical protein [Rubrivirga sp. F394]MDT0632208.1 hypothetical protein [Rubrivirga sp. F394]